MTSCIGFLISMFGTRMCGQTLLFIVRANCAIIKKTEHTTLLQANYVTGQWAICDYKNDSATATTD